MRRLVVVLLLLLVTPAWGQVITKWQAGGIYPQGSLVSFQGTIFLCSALSGCTGDLGGSQSPANSSPVGIWNAMSGANQWRSDIKYNTGTMVMQSGTLFSAIVTNTNMDPAGGAHPETWFARGSLPGPLFNVRAFGAIGTGCPTDDTAAFLAAIAAATAAPGPSRSVYVPAGIYCITSTLTIAREYFSFYGDGASSVLVSTTTDPILRLNPDPGSVGTCPPPGGGPITGGPTGYSVHDLKFSGTSTRSGIIVTPDQAATCVNAGRSRYYNLLFEEFGTAIRFAGKSDWDIFTNITFTSGLVGMRFDGIGTGNVFSAMTIQSSLVGIDIARDGIDNGIGDMTFSGLQFGGGFDTGIRFVPGPGIYSERVAIVNAQFDASGVGNPVGIDMQNFTNVNVWGVALGGNIINDFTGTTGVISVLGATDFPDNNKATLKNMKTSGAAGKKVVCIDTSTGELFASSTGTDCN